MKAAIWNQNQDSTARHEWTARERAPRNLVEAAQRRRDADREEMLASIEAVQAIPIVQEPNPGGRKPKDDKQIRQLVEEGLTPAEISEVLNRNLNSLYRRLRIMGLRATPEATSEKRRAMERRDNRIAELVREGELTTKEIADQLGIPPATVQSAIIRKGLRTVMRVSSSPLEMTESVTRRIRAMVEIHATDKEIAEALGCTYRQAGHARRRLGLPSVTEWSRAPKGRSA